VYIPDAKEMQHSIQVLFADDIKHTETIHDINRYELPVVMERTCAKRQSTKRYIS